LGEPEPNNGNDAHTNAASRDAGGAHEMILAYHAIFSAYGSWLPNDPRGSWSDFVRKWELFRFGSATKVHGRRSVARAEHDADQRLRAKEALRYPPVAFTGLQARAIGRGFAEAVAEGTYAVHACSILPQHVHIVVGRHERPIGRIVGHLKARATQRLKADALHPLAAYRQRDGSLPSPWGRRGWNVFLNDEEHLRNAVRYVQENPVKEGKPQQRWGFVTPLAW
jgi:REP element-mobilizing transposase RayT